MLSLMLSLMLALMLVLMLTLYDAYDFGAVYYMDDLRVVY